MVNSEEAVQPAVERLESFLSDPLLFNNWAQVQSRHLLNSVAPEAAERIDYTYSVARLKRVSTSALHSALGLLRSNPTGLHKLSDQLRRVAEVMEYLANLPEETRPNTTRLIAAGLYQLAGYEANSLCIARELHFDPVPQFRAYSRFKQHSRPLDGTSPSPSVVRPQG